MLPDMDFRLYISFSSYRKEEAQSGAFALQFITDFQPHSFWKDAYKWTIYKEQLQINKSEQW